jgi:hypothetical protein
MPNSRYFIFGDILANSAAALISALVCFWLIPHSLSMLVAMMLSMVLGMFIAMVLALAVLMRYFGAMEIMLPTMISAMIAGMAVGMRITMGELTPLDACIYAVLIGLTVNATCWAVNSRLRGKVPQQAITVR